MFARRKRPRLALVTPAEEQPAVYTPPAPHPEPALQEARVDAEEAAPPPSADRPRAEPLLEVVPTKVKERRRRGPIPPFLVHGGNHQVWKSVAKLISTEKVATILLHGPHGCGKTRGVHELALSHLGLTVYEINASNVEGVERLAKDVRHVTRTKTLLGPRLLLVDDLEGFDETYVDKVAELLKARVEGDGPMVITCHNPFDRSLVKLRALTTMHRVRMYDPRPEAMAAAVKTIANYPHSVVLRYAAECRHNYHQLFIRLKVHAQSEADIPVGFLETTQALLKREVDVDTWKRVNETPILVALLHENAPAIAGRGRGEDELERCASFLDCVSLTAHLPAEARADVVGRSAQLALFTREVPSLRLSKAPIAVKPDRTSWKHAL